MAIILCRVDDRLIHGQVATSWIRTNNIEVVIIIDDKIATDELQMQILKMAAPTGVKVYAVTVDKFLEKYNLGIFEKYRVMIIFENVFALESIIKAGVDFDVVNIAGIRFKEGRKQISKSVFITEAEQNTILNITQGETKLIIQQLMTDPKINLMDLL